MSSLAQEESRSISENTTWGKRKMFADGRASIGFKHFLGYDRGPEGEFIINEEQAVAVRYIYKRYLEGYSTYKIACELTEMGVKTPAGIWSSLVQEVIVKAKDDIVFIFKNGFEVSV